MLCWCAVWACVRLRVCEFVCESDVFECVCCSSGVDICFITEYLSHLFTRCRMIGFCFGAWVNFHASASGRISCAVNCHPSVRLEGLWGSNEVDLAKTVKCPQMLLPAGNDPDNIKPGSLLLRFRDSQLMTLEKKKSLLFEMATMRLDRAIRTEDYFDGVESEKTGVVFHTHAISVLTG